MTGWQSRDGLFASFINRTSCWEVTRVSFRTYFFYCKYEAKLIKEAFLEVYKKVTTLREGVNVVKCQGVIRQEHKLLTIARLEKYKGIQHFIATLCMFDGHTLYVVGVGPFRTALTNLVNQLVVQDKVRFHGTIDAESCNAVICEASVLSLLYNESFSIVVGEALSAGMPCIVPKHGALSEWIDNRGYFAIDDTSDSKALVELIESGDSAFVTTNVPSWDGYMPCFSHLIMQQD